jgi:adenylate kinase
MAPTDSAVVEELKSIIKKLESRVEQLEGKLSGKDASSSSMRMILMGPPGAGRSSPSAPLLSVTDLLMTMDL